MSSANLARAPRRPEHCKTRGSPTGLVCASGCRPIGSGGGIPDRVSWCVRLSANRLTLSGAGIPDRVSLCVRFQEGVKQGVVHALVEVYEARFGAMPEDLREVVEDTDDEPTLVAWLRLAGTRSADEIAAAIRSFRAS